MIIEVHIPWGDGDYTFALRGKQIEELQLVCGSPDNPAGIGLIAQRLMSGNFQRKDVTETIRLGLIGGGTTPTRARQLVEAYVDGQPLANPEEPYSPFFLARRIVEAAYFGIKPPGEEEAKPTEKATSTSPKSEPWLPPYASP